MKDIYYVIRWVRGKRGKNKILGKYETVKEAKKHYPTREEMAKMMYEDVIKWEYKDVSNVMLLDDEDQFSIEMEGEGVSDYLGPRCCGQPLERVFDLDYIKWRDVRKDIKGADNKEETLFLEALATMDEALTKKKIITDGTKEIDTNKGTSMDSNTLMTYSRPTCLICAEK